MKTGTDGDTKPTATSRRGEPVYPSQTSEPEQRNLPSAAPADAGRVDKKAGAPPEAGVLDAFASFVEKTYGEDLSARIRALQFRKNECGVDPFGFDPATARQTLAAIVFMHRTYFRTQVFGLENTPPGRALYIGNHSGHVPIDGMLVAASLLLDRDPPVLVRSMVEKWAQTLPFVSQWFPRVGQVLGSPENARRLLADENPLLVFPEGVRGISKPFSKRYQLMPFGNGFMRLALETRTPVIPVAVIGGEEQYPALFNLKGLARIFGAPSFPIIPQMLLGMPLPLPTRYRIYFGEPLMFEGDPDDDDQVVEGFVDEVRGAIQRMLHRGLAERAHVFW